MSEKMYCVNHPDRETLLRCNKCGKPICLECGIRHPVGIRCRECAQLRRSPLYQVSAVQYAKALGVGLAASTIGGLIMAYMGGIFISLFLSPIIGGVIAEAINWATGYKRGVMLQIVAGICIVLGALLGQHLLFYLATPVPLRRLTLSALLNLGVLLSPFNLIYIVLAVGAAIARLR